MDPGHGVLCLRDGFAMSIDYRQYPVLYVDDERPNLVAMRYALDDEFEVLTANSGGEALGILGDRDIAVLLSDQRMPGMTGVELCEKVQQQWPDVMRIIITAYADMHAAIDAINRGKVTRYITKPYDNDELADTVRTAIDLVHIHRSVRDLEVRVLQSSSTTTAKVLQNQIAHELNNSLTPLTSCLQYLGDLHESAYNKLKSDPEQASKLLSTAHDVHHDVMTSVHQITGIVQRMAEGRRGDAVQSWSDVARVVDSTVRILRPELEKAARLQVVLESSPRSPIEASALGQIMTNLLLNAANAIEEAGSGTESQDLEPTISVRVTGKSGEARIRVSDNGPGISDDLLERIFDPYFTTRAEGSGLGLAITRQLVEEAGGRIEVESTLGKGTSFCVILANSL